MVTIEHVKNLFSLYVFIYCQIQSNIEGAVVAEWLSSWLAEQEDRGSIPGLAT